MSTRRAAGFTIVELLVVITIIGILMALVFPAINVAREAARRGQCINNIGQVGKGLQAKTMRKGDFPKHLAKVNGTSHRWPWAVHILTEIGRGDVFDFIETKNSSNASEAEQRIDIFICPSDMPISKTDMQLNYAGNTGIAGFNEAAANVIFQETTTVSIGFVAQKDGAATTLMLAENLDATYWNSATYTQDKVFETGLIWKASAPTCGGLNKNKDCSGADKAKPSSNHSGGFVAAFCDGHAKFLSNEIGYDVYALLMTPHGSAVGQSTPLTEADLDK